MRTALLLLLLSACSARAVTPTPVPVLKSTPFTTAPSRPVAPPVRKHVHLRTGTIAAAPVGAASTGATIVSVVLVSLVAVFITAVVIRFVLNVRKMKRVLRGLRPNR